MKTIGIVGGMGWPSTIAYYRTINELVALRMGGSGLHSARLILVQTDFDEICHHEHVGRWDLIGDLIAEQGNKLKSAGADFFLLACNTVHGADKQIERAVDLPFLHIVDPTAREALSCGFKTIGLLGSGYTMTASYFVERLRDRYGLHVLIPDAADRDTLNDALFTELAKGIVLPGTRATFTTVINDLVARGADVIVLGCTEFGTLLTVDDSPVPIIDTTIAHARAAVDLAFA